MIVNILLVMQPVFAFRNHSAVRLFAFVQGVLDITTTEVADHIVGGVMACDSSRFDCIIEKKIPLVLSVGALDMVNFGAIDTIPSNFKQRKIYKHNEQVLCSFICESL